ncbi:N-acetylmuramoyl-L-alanine amidase-like domain-containing protein [Prevotella aurantiaca]|uniref:DUF1460 domain-containing protein n=1 Tax=Prevotella aurantiaca TaxID=596085 RepID=A0A930MY85_9BACT|nr:N-acetylmuramoyl-L-alanine amidase-like domain-containing protein [Prevotella aurantiaca]MBF1383468.1 DUF1460 domain-containing protein [Prevotella aurantiaca]
MKAIRILLLLILLFISNPTTTQTMGNKPTAEVIKYSQQGTTKAVSSDASRIESLLAQLLPLRTKLSKEDIILKAARHFVGIPYVAHTLDRNNEEMLVVNTREMDCTTYLEYVIAVVLCVDKNLSRYSDFTRMLQNIRYRQGCLAYENRLHYYQWWVTDNQQMGYVKEISAPNPPFTATQKLKINYMSENPNAYDMLRNRPQRVATLKKLEDQTNGTIVPYIPKKQLTNTELLRKVVRNGDIIAITTNKLNLDTTHLGFAVWHRDGLHLINASSLKKNGRQVVEPKETIYQYLLQRPQNTGIRVSRLILDNLC